MRNFWIIFKDEYKKRVGKRSFMIATLAIPVGIAILFGVIILLATRSSGEKPVGYVDLSGLISGEVSLPSEQTDYTVEIKRFPSETDARKALEAGQIQSFFVIPSDYMQTGKLDRYDWQGKPSNGTVSEFSRFLRVSLAAPLPTEAQKLIVDGPKLSVRSMDGSREVGSGNVGSVLVPIIAGLLFFFSTMTSAGFLLQVVTDEKENRTMEILMTSISPEQFISGKALSLMAVALTQLAIWLAVIVLALVVGARYVPELQNFNIPPDYLLVLLFFFLPAYALIAGFEISIGSVVTEMRQGQQVAGLLNMAFVLPFFFVGVILSDPNSPLMVILTLFPTTSFITVSMRWGLSAIPFLQLALSWLILILSAAASIWAATRIFRLGMLSYGQRLSLQSALSALHFRNVAQGSPES